MKKVQDELQFSKASQTKRTPKPGHASRKSKVDLTAMYQLARDQIRYLTWNRAPRRCQRCGVSLTLDAAHIHEVKHRSQGGSPLDLENTRCYCPTCHGEIHE